MSSFEVAALARHLESLGLGPRDAQVYLALLGPPKTPGEVGEEIGTATSLAGTALEELTRRGFVRRLPGAETRYSLAPPERSLPPLVRTKEAEIDVLRDAIENIAERYHSAGGTIPESDVEVVVGAEAAIAQISGLQARARKEVLGFVKAPFFSLENEGETQALTRGVPNRWLWEASTLELPGMMAVARSYRDAGEELRVTPEVPSKMVIIDREVAVIHIREATAGGSIAGALSTRHPELLSTFLHLFELLWSSGISPFEAEEGDGPPDTGQKTEQRLIECLAAGMTDTAIARDLRISRRTLTRRIQELMDSLNVRNRFQAGYRLGVEHSDGDAAPWRRPAEPPVQDVT